MFVGDVINDEKVGSRWVWWNGKVWRIPGWRLFLRESSHQSWMQSCNLHTSSSSELCVGYRTVIFQSDRKMDQASNCNDAASYGCWAIAGWDYFKCFCTKVKVLKDCVTSGLIMAFGLNYLGGYSVYKTFGLHLFYWIVMDFSLMTSMQVIARNFQVPRQKGSSWGRLLSAEALLRRSKSYPQLFLFQNGKFNFTPFLFVFIWLFREFTSPFIFIKAVLAPTIVWRNNKFKLSWGGRIRTSKSKFVKCAADILRSVFFNTSAHWIFYI